MLGNVFLYFCARTYKPSTSYATGGIGRSSSSTTSTSRGWSGCPAWKGSQQAGQRVHSVMSGVRPGPILKSMHVATSIWHVANMSSCNHLNDMQHTCISYVYIYICIYIYIYISYAYHMHAERISWWSKHHVSESQLQEFSGQRGSIRCRNDPLGLAGDH